MMSESGLIQVMIVDDHPVVRNGIRFSLLAFNDIEVVGEAGSGQESIDLCAEVQPDVVLMDLAMPGINGVETTRTLREAFPRLHVLALTSFQEGSLVQEALQAGAIGYLLKDVSIDELARAVRLAAHGQATLAPAAGQALVQNATQAPKIGHDLTEREREVLALLVEGLSNQQVAERLVISPATVKFHISSIRSKLGASSRTEVVILAMQHKLVK
ncbi:MAG TPA: response regulator transcription factor [Ktedonobacterales bacterium]|nr:response regulator transcription factor [Ktedonobacterales bacterium]